MFSIHTIPHILLSSLQHGGTDLIPIDDKIEDVPIKEASQILPDGVLPCNSCQLLQTDKFHFKSDFHRFNLKRKLAGSIPIGEEEFDDLEELSSIEGSEEEDGEDDIPNQKQGSPYATFTFQDLRENKKKELLVYKQVLHSKSKEKIDYINELSNIQLKNGEKRTWALFLMASGHFSSAVVDIQSGKPIVHKTFHRYTTRRKQGGAQSSNDKSKGKAKSAGAGIRRYNEQALNEEIQDLLKGWKELIHGCSLIFVRATATMKGTLFFASSPLNSADDRIRTFPFITKRPTLSELSRCFQALSTPQIHDFCPDITQKELLILKTKPDSRVENIIEAVKKGKLDIVKSLLLKFEVNEKLADSTGISLLHIAALNSQPEMVNYLLEQNADPTLRGDNNDVKAYDLSVSKETRDVFRRYMARNPLRWDYQLSNIPSPLTEESEERAREREKERRRKEKERKKELKKELAPVIEPEVEDMSKKSRNISINGLRRSDKESLGMSPEQRTRLDREKRALAAESRQK